MKNGLFIWNVVLSLVAGYLLIIHFNSKKGNIQHDKASSANNTAGSNQFRMAYFEMDSVAANFDLVKELRTELAKKEEEINSEIDKLSKNMQQRYNYYQNQAQAGSLSQAQSETASQELKSLDDQIKNRKQQLDTEFNELTMRRQNDIKSKIEEFLKKYNETKKYSYIVSYEQGLFYLKDTAYNITSDVVKGLNELYKPKVK